MPFRAASPLASPSLFHRRLPLVPALAVVLPLAVSGCALKRDEYETPPVPLPQTFREAGKAPGLIAAGQPAAPQAVAPSEAVLPQDLSRWWERFGSRELNDLVERALDQNWTVRAAVARLAQAEAAWKRTRAGEIPHLDGFANAEATAPPGGAGTRRAGQPLTSERTFEIGVRASYEVDLWGANRAATVAALEQAEASAAARRTVAWTLTADVVTAYLQYLSLSDRITTAQATLRVMRELQDAVRERMIGGDADALQLAQQRAAVAEASSVIPVLELQRDQAQHAIALLLGTTPDQLHLRGTSMRDVAYPTIAPGMPSHLLLRRPDILQAEHELLAADANIDEARAAFLPSFNLTADTGYGSNYLSSLLSPQSLMWTVAASVLVSIFDAGENDARLAAARARHQELIATYMQACYSALREVEDALSSVHYLGERMTAQREAVAAAREAHGLSREAYGIGTVDYLTLLDTERTLFDNEDILHRIEFERANASVALFKALGGDAETQADSGIPEDTAAAETPLPVVAEPAPVEAATPPAPEPAVISAPAPEPNPPGPISVQWGGAGRQGSIR